MLAPHELELLTAHVDGELTIRQARQVEVLLRDSAEARTLLARLESDAARLRRLPRRAVPDDLCAGIMAAIAEQGRKPVRKPQPVRSFTRLRAFMGVAAAAAVLVAIGIGSFLMHSPPTNPDGTDPSLARHGNEVGDLAKSNQSENNIVPIPENKGTESPEPRGKDIELSEPSRPTPGGVVADSSTGKPSEAAPRQPGEILADGGREPFNKFERVELALPQVFTLHDLDGTGNEARLGEQLGKGSSYRVELPARDATRGFELLRTAFKSREGLLVLDPAVQSRLKRPTWKTDFAIYAEDVTPKDLARLLRTIGQADREGSDRRAFDGHLIVKEVGATDRKEIKELLGVDPLAAKMPTKPAVKPLPDIRKPLEEQTAVEVVATLEGKGVPRPSTGELRGMVLLLSGPRSRSAELKRYLETRRPVRPGTISVLLVLRNLPG